MLHLPDGQWTTTQEEAYMHLLETHFPGCRLMKEAHQDSSTRWSFKFHHEEVDNIVMENRMQWTTSTMALTNHLDRMASTHLQKGSQSLLYPLCKIYWASISLGYIPKIWREASVTFLPKSGKNDYTHAKAYRPICLTFFLLKGLEKLVDRHLKDGPLLGLPIHPRQHAFQAGKSTESALH